MARFLACHYANDADVGAALFMYRYFAYVRDEHTIKDCFRTERTLVFLNNEGDRGDEEEEQDEVLDELLEVFLGLVGAT